MSINSISLELPTKLEEIFEFSLNFEGLKRVLQFFQKNNSILVSSIKDFNKRITLFESLKSDIDAIKIRSEIIERKNQEINDSFKNINQKLISLEVKVNDFSKESEEQSKNLKKQEEILGNHKDYIDSLKLSVENNVISIKEIDEKYNGIKENININNLKMNEIEIKNKETIEKIIGNNGDLNTEQLTVNQQIELINEDIENLTRIVNDLKKTTEIKNKEYDECMSDFLKNVTVTKKRKNKANSLEFAFMENNDNINSFSGEDDDSILKSELEKEKKKFGKLFEEIKSKEEKLIEENTTNKMSIKALQNNLTNIKTKFNDLFDENNNNNFIINNKINKNLEILTNDKYKMITENIKILSVALNSKPNKDDLESLKRNIELRLKKLEILQNDSIEIKKQLKESQERKANKSLMESKNIEYIIQTIQSSINENITNLIKDSILKYGKNIDLSNNYAILELIKRNKKYFDDINKRFISTIEDRNKLIKELDDRIDIMNEEIHKLIENHNTHNDKLNDMLKIIDDTDEEEQRDQLFKGNIKERVYRLYDLYYEVRDRIVLIEKKNLAFSREVKEEVKYNLKTETTKIVEQFKNKLSSFTYKFEDELRNKIDQIGLYTLEKRINSKLITELKEKINKKELKQNNNAINRKIDSLESKISQTLVDTIIDIQMDEAPLLVKKNNNLEICASCNQLLKKNKSLDNDSIASPNKTYNNKFRIKNVKCNGASTQTMNAKAFSLSPNKFLPEININNTNSNK